jgi:hypothetical protein
MHCRRSTTAVLTSGSVVIAAVHFPMALVVVAVIVLLVYAGIILPAIWSAKPTRRRDARAVLQQILRFLQEPRSP